MSWTDILAGGAVNPSYTVIVSYTPLADIALDWPNVATSATALGDINELFVYVAGLKIKMPDATKGSAGGASLFVNKGSQTITLTDFTGSAIGTVGAGQAVFVYLASTGSTAGTWTVFVFAAGSSLAQAAALSSPSIAPRGNTLVQATPVSSLNSDYTTGVSDQGSVLNWVGGVGTYTLADAGVLGAGWFAHVRNSGTGALTLNPTTGSLNTVDGAATMLFNPGESAIVICDGLKFITISKTTSQTTTFAYTSLDVSGTGAYNISTAQTGYDVYRLTGTLTGNRQIVFPTTLAQFTIRNETTGAFTLTVKTAAAAGTVVGTNEAKIVYCDGTDIKPSSTAGISFPVDITQGGTGATSAASALTNLGASSIGKALFQAASAAAARSAMAFGALGDSIASLVSTMLLGPGTAPAPMYSFSTDPDSGLWSRGANSVGIAVNGVDTYKFDTTGASYWDGATFRTFLTSAGAWSVAGNITMTAGGELQMYGFAASANQSVIRMSSDVSKYLFWDNTNFNFNGGGLICSGNITAFSDAKLKEDIRPIRNAMDALRGVMGVTYTRIETGNREMGLIAQNVREFAPEVVTSTKTLDGDEVLGIAYGNLHGMVIAALNELDQRIAALEVQ